MEQIYYLSKYFAITLICKPAWLGDYSRLHMLQIHQSRKLEPGRGTGVPLHLPGVKVPPRIESDGNRFLPIYADSKMVVW